MKKLWKHLLECSENELFAWTVITILILIAALLLISTRAHAQPQELQGLLCDKPEGVSSVFAYKEANPDASIKDGLEAVDKLGYRCVVTTYIGEKVGLPLGKVQIRDEDRGEIYRVNVIARCEQGACMTFEEGVIAYAAFPLEPSI